MSPLRLLGSLLASSRHRICGTAARSANLLHHRLPHGRRRAMAAMVATLSGVTLVGVGSMSLHNFKRNDDDDDDDDDDNGEDTEKSVVVSVSARNPGDQYNEALERKETVEEKAMKTRFAEWMVEYGRRYKDGEEKAMRYEMFRRTARFVDERNARPGRLSTCGTNKFADRTEEELSWLCGGCAVPDDELARLQRDRDQRP